ncbi:Alginate export domain containing protein [Methylophilaceae bacterium]
MTRHPSLKKLSLLIALGLSSLASFANEADTSTYTLTDAIKNGQSMTGFRLRYENVNQDSSNNLKNANAFTLRSLIGWQTAAVNNFSLGAQLIGVTDLNGDFNDKKWNINAAGKAGYAVVQDPNYYNVNQLYLDWTAIPDTQVRLGQQSLKLDNVRFIGNVEFRQVMQVFTGLTVENKSITNTDIQAGYYTQFRKASTSQQLNENTGILHASYHLSPTENLTAYGYWYDANDDKFAVTGSANPSSLVNLSNRSLGIRADGRHPIDAHWQLLYTAEYAQQADIAGGDSHIKADYYKLGLGVAKGSWYVRADQELLGTNNALYAFQTPLGTNHLFQGWVDKFAASTPVHGIKDSYITAGGKWQDFTFLTEYHWFNADQDFSTGAGTGKHYGKEWDFSMAYAYNKQTSAKLEYGTFNEGDYYGGVSAATRYRNTDKLWLTSSYLF